MLFQNFDQKIALVCAVVGILLLFFLEISIKPVPLKIGLISGKDIDSMVSVNARIDWVKKTPNSLMLGLNDGNRINAVLFSPTVSESNFLKKNSFAKIEGKVKRYNENLEIVIQRVDLID